MWIKLHRKMLDDYEFHCLPVASRALAPMLWLYASEFENGIMENSDGKIIEKICFRIRMDENAFMEALLPMVKAGFFGMEEDDSKPLAECLPREEKRREEKEKNLSPKKPKKKTTKKPQKNSLPLFFEEFWTAYPYRVAKIDAKKAWAKLKPDATLLALVLAAIEEQKAGQLWRQENGKYIPHPANWLDAGRWLDEVRPVVPQWWDTRESMKEMGMSLNPPILPADGDTLGGYRKRIEAALDPNSPHARMPTVYAPPLPKGGESMLTPDQLAVRRAEMLAAAKKGEQALANRPKVQELADQEN